MRVLTIGTCQVPQKDMNLIITKNNKLNGVHDKFHKRHTSKVHVKSYFCLRHPWKHLYFFLKGACQIPQKVLKKKCTRKFPTKLSHIGSDKTQVIITNKYLL